MSDIWAPVVAALGSSLLTGLIAFGLEWWRSRKADKSALAERRSRAYSALLARSTAIMHLASNLHALMEIKSGLREGINTLIGKSSSADPIEIMKWADTASTSLYEAWSEVWAIGSKEAIAEANSLVTWCGEVMGTGVQRGKAIPTWLTGIVGEKWTQEQISEWQKAMNELAESRRKFGMIAREETGLKVADLFANNDVQQAADSSTRPISQSQRRIRLKN